MQGVGILSGIPEGRKVFAPRSAVRDLLLMHLERQIHRLALSDKRPFLISGSAKRAEIWYGSVLPMRKFTGLVSQDAKPSTERGAKLESGLVRSLLRPFAGIRILILLRRTSLAARLSDWRCWRCRNWNGWRRRSCATCAHVPGHRVTRAELEEAKAEYRTQAILAKRGL
jgi:hypothetical protein